MCKSEEKNENIMNGTPQKTVQHLPAERVDPSCVFGNRTRYVILILATLCLSSILGNILTFNFTFICMTEAPAVYQNIANVTAPVELTVADNASLAEFERVLEINHQIEEKGAEFHYTPSQKSFLFSAVAVGALLAVFPISYALQTFGARWTFSIVGFVSAFSTAAVPTAARMGLSYFLAIRALQGVGLAACLPIIGSVTAHWATLKQSGVFIALLSSFLQIAPIVTMPVAGELCTSQYGWPAVYYLHAFVTVILFAAFVFYFRNAPKKHPSVSNLEIGKIVRGKIDLGPDAKKVPYMAIMKSPAVWGIWIAAIGNFFGTQLVLQFTPTYLNKVLMVPVEKAGLASALPSFIMFFIKLGAGLTSDKVTCLPETLKVRVYNTLALGGQGFFFIALAFVPPSEAMLALVALICATSILGFNSGGFFKSTQLLARHHSHFIMGHISLINCVCMLVVPILVDFLAPEDLPHEWMRVFIVHGAILIVSNVIFCFLATGKPAPWALTVQNKHKKLNQVYAVKPISGSLTEVKVN
uniref:Major facilitator superfamily (MFS) profile domain-containing protein n=1 Tax=Plectus sambesii TaxID=2011161 RepID=A0A914XM53_9BILA